MAHVEANIPEDQPIHEPFFAVQAIDKDRNEVRLFKNKILLNPMLNLLSKTYKPILQNGRVTYELVSSEPPCPVIVR